MSFVSLHNQSTLSILDSLIEPAELIKKAKELNMPAVALTDHGTLAGIWEAFQTSKTENIKLIVGCELYFQDQINDGSKFRHLILIAKNAIGYQNLLTLNKLGFDHKSFIGKRVYSVIDWKLLEQYSEGLICLTACGNGIISQLLMNKKFDQAEQTLLKLKELFGNNLGIEVQPNNMKRFANIYNDEIDQQFLNRKLIDLGKKYNIKVVAACNAHYLNKEDHDIHDTLLAIGSHQPKSSGFRIKYTVPDFYLKSEEEIKTFFSRNYGEEYARELCDNSIYFANLCENPEWVDPKFSNPSGKELPIFPVKDEINYNEFKNWLENQNEFIKGLSEDKAYLRYKCQLSIQSYVKDFEEEKKKIYYDRLAEELEVMEFHEFSSYMLIVSDYANWARKNNIAVGAGRGCLTKDTLVLTDKGFTNLDEINVGDKVYSHTGKLQEIKNKFKFDIKNEKLLKFKIENSFGELTMTKDHKIFACKKQIEQYCKYYQYGNKKQKYIGNKLIINDPQWFKAEDLKIGDFIYTTFPITNNINYTHTYDLGKYIRHEKLDESTIQIKTNIIHKFSIKQIARDTGIPFEQIRKVKNNIINSHPILENYLTKHNLNVENWRKIPKYNTYNINRTIILDNEFLYILGRWVGDGSLRHYDHGINFAFHAKDIVGIDRISKFFKNNNIHICKIEKDNSCNLDIGTQLLTDLFKDIFPDYKRTSQTKHLPAFFRSLSKNQLIYLLKGLIDSDGYINGDTESIKTTSYRLVKEIKEALDILCIPSGVHVEDPPNGWSRSYNIRFSGINTPLKTTYIYNNGYYSKITKILEVEENYVYDITVNNDHSYLTSSGVVHNSVGGSLVAYLINIHKADPIKYNLIFARFLNKEKTAYPDVDIDFAPSGRYKIQNYLRKKYGEDHVAHVSNFNTITPKVYIRDISRACELGGDKETAVKIGNDIAGCVSADISDIDEALRRIPLFGEYCKKYPELIKYKKICGKYRALSTHAGGIVLGARNLVGLIPLRRDKDGILALEFDKDKAEANGLIKMDILGLSTLDVIEDTYKIIQQRNKVVPEKDFDFGQEDQATYDLIANGDTNCVFQFGTSAGTIDLCKRIKPKDINDLANINALARPSAREMRNDFISVKDGKKPFTLLHPKLERAFKSTYGFGLYEECLMYLAQDVAGWSLHSADRLRKLTKEKGKNPKKVQEWKEEFILDAIKNGINKEIAKRIWNEVIELFGGYGFNASHAVLYSMIGFQTAYLKAHYPIEFLLANLMLEVQSNSPTAPSNIAVIKKELKRYKVKIEKPDVNKSQRTYSISDDNKLLSSLDSIKFLGDDAIEDIIAKRPFKNFLDFMVRVDSKKVRANNIQALVGSGALDSFKIPRRVMFQYVSDYRKKLQVWSKKHNPETETFEYPFPKELEWNLSEMYAIEQYYLNEAFVCKPAEAYGKFFKDMHNTVYDIKKLKDKQPINAVKFIVRDFFEFKVKKETSKFYNKNMAKITGEDKDGNQISITVFPDRWEHLNKKIKDINSKCKFENGLALNFSGKVNYYEDNVGIIFENLLNIAPIPALPDDLKIKKKINLNEAKLDKKEKTGDLFTDIENDLYDQGLIDFPDDEDN